MTAHSHQIHCRESNQKTELTIMRGGAMNHDGDETETFAGDVRGLHF